jgi:hypothetical protein
MPSPSVPPAGTDSTKSGCLIVLAIFGGLIFLGVVGVGALTWWIIANKDRLAADASAARKKAEAYAKDHTQAECVDEAFREQARCPGLGCDIKTRLFLEQCARTAQPTPGFCDGVPEPKSVLAVSAWALKECVHRSARNQDCSQLLQAIPPVCHPTELDKAPGPRG